MEKSLLRVVLSAGALVLVMAATPFLSKAQAQDSVIEHPPTDADAAESVEHGEQGRTSFGGYGDFSWVRKKGNDADVASATADMVRVVLYVHHEFNDDAWLSTEFEWEHAIACADEEECPGEAALEQAHVNYRLADHDDAISRSGLILVPFGAINMWHEPPTYNGVDRPAVEKQIIPSTWREIGTGAYGSPLEGFEYQAYLMATFDPTRFDAEGIRGARSKGGKSPGKGYALALRGDYTPLSDLRFGLGLYGAEAGPNADVVDSAGERLSLDFPIYGWELDFDWRIMSGLRLRGLATSFMMPNAGDLADAYVPDDTGVLQPLFEDPTINPDAAIVGEELFGYYADLGFDFMSLTESEKQLILFGRYEFYDTQAAVPSGYKKDESLSVTETLIGLHYLPIPRISVKADYLMKQSADSNDKGSTAIRLGMGYVF